MPHYLLSVHSEADRGEFGAYGSREEMEAAFATTGAFNDKLQAAGHWVYAGGLVPVAGATVVDGRADSPVLTQGPYLTGDEALGGFWIIDAPDRDTALALAAEASAACRGTVEVRQLEGT